MAGMSAWVYGWGCGGMSVWVHGCMGVYGCMDAQEEVPAEDMAQTLEEEGHRTIAIQTSIDMRQMAVLCEDAGARRKIEYSVPLITLAVSQDTVLGMRMLLQTSAACDYHAGHLP